MKFEIVALDSTAAIDFLNPRRPTPPPVREAGALALPLPVLGELYFGTLRASPEFRDRDAERVSALLALSRLLSPGEETAHFYARIRLQIAFPPNMSRRRETHLLNDLWIAALCVQHKLPLLSNDRDFDGIEGLEVIHW